MYLSIAILFAQLGNVTSWEEQNFKNFTMPALTGSNTMLIQPWISGNIRMLGIATN